MIKRTYTLEHLGCAGCAGKMEKRIRDLEGVHSAEVLFPLKTLVLEVESIGSLDLLLPRIEKIIHALEPRVRLKEKPCRASSDPADDLVAWEKLAGANKPLLAAMALFLLSFLLPWDIPATAALLGAYGLSGHAVIRAGIANLFSGSVFDENLLMTLATVSAWSIGEAHEAAAVMIFYSIGEVFENRAVDHSRSAIKSLLKLKPQTATLYRNGGLSEVPPEDVPVGSILMVRPGERIPLDGTVLEGDSLADTSAITGESRPRTLEPGDPVYSGFINQTGSLKIRVDKPFSDSAIKRILILVEEAAAHKAETEKFITRFARVYTPVVVAVAALIAIGFPAAGFSGFRDSLYKAAVFLVVSCPCALVVSVPLSFFGGIGTASRHGILVKGGNHLETLGKAKTMLFDKTGTLTQGAFRITRLRSVSRFTEEDLLHYAAHVESRSRHPIARSILEAYGKPVDQALIEDFQEVSGRGVQALIEGKLILVGNSRLLASFNVLHEAVSAVGTVLYIAIDNHYAGHIVISDTLKSGVAEGLSQIRYEGVKKTVLLTGDKEDLSQSLGDHLQIDRVHAELLPREKADLVKAYAETETVAFVGDGINDAPALATASVGISMGALGSDAAIEASDIVIMDDDIGRIAVAMRIAQAVRGVVRENIVIALGVKFLIMGLSLFGLANLWAAVFADVGMTVLAVLNSIRILRKKY